MKESTEIEEKLPDKKHEDAVLKYLAENHPDDENALSEMTALLDGATDSQALLDAGKTRKTQKMPVICAAKTKPSK